MPEIFLSAYVNAPAQRCFDLSRSIELHMLSTSKTNEIAIAGKTSGLISKGETVTWEATHFFIRQQLTVVIEEMESPTYFTDRMLKGAFKSFYHQHFFEESSGATLMTEMFTYESPFGIIGKIFDKLILKKYMTRFLVDRFNMVKHFAETEEWRKVL